MKKYIEFGIGNTWILRTEAEMEDNTEIEQQGILGPINVKSIYLRIWIGKTVVLLDSREGFKKMSKNRKSFKLIIGIVST